MSGVPIIRGAGELAALIGDWRAEGATIGVVPTMGALHEGHLSLVRAAQGECDRVIVTLFVNPRQFNNPEDFAKYPRTEDADAAILAPLEVDALFVPDAAEVYPPGHATVVSVGGIGTLLEGAHRPGHFDGVATVVALLLNLTRADRAYFGEKDWQQLQVVRQMVADLRMPVRIVACPSVRAEDGVALSSRNQRLSPDARRRAAAIPQALGVAQNRVVIKRRERQTGTKQYQRQAAQGVVGLTILADDLLQFLGPLVAGPAPLGGPDGRYLRAAQVGVGALAVRFDTAAVDLWHAVGLGADGVAADYQQQNRNKQGQVVHGESSESCLIRFAADAQ